MSIAGTLVATVGGNGIRTGATPDEVADIAQANVNVNNPIWWEDEGCTALVWGITNLAGVPLCGVLNGDTTSSQNPLTPLSVNSAPNGNGYVVPGPLAGEDQSGDGWTKVSAITTTNYASLLERGDAVRIWGTGNSAVGRHSFIVTDVGLHTTNTIKIVDNWGASSMYPPGWTVNGRFGSSA